MSIRERMKRRVLVLDGAMGTMIQGYRLEEADFRGERFHGHPTPLKGNNDLLSLTRPEVIEEIHRSYLEVGADIIETNTFNSTSISQADYGLAALAAELNVAGARLARKAADSFSESSKPRFVAGSIGPTNKAASISPRVEDPAFRAVTFDEMASAYEEQILGLIEGGVDILLVETVFDTLNAKAALFAAENAFRKRDTRLPVMVSVTLSDASRRLLSGQTLEAFLVSIAHADLLSVGINCSLGARDLLESVRQLAGATPLPVTVHPNAGLPNQLGVYDETPRLMADQIRAFTDLRLVNVIGGCCGTTPEHVRLLAELAADAEPRIPPALSPRTSFSGLEVLTVERGSNFVNIGERTNVMGSKRFARLIRDGNLEEAVSVARDQVNGGAQILDVCMDEAMLDAEFEMTRFLRRIGAEPDIARVPVMIDSSRWSVIEAGLKCTQGKSIVNSISLKEGEDVFREHARTIRKFGAAAIVMAFDERGQADSFERKIEVVQRAHRILEGELGFPPENIIFDPNVLAVGTGIPEHNSFAVDYIRAVRWIKEHLPHAKVSGGVSNLSFAFRGHEAIRRAMHSVFLCHAIRSGMDMGIVNPAQLDLYDDIPKELLERVEDLVLNRRPDATERLIEFAKGFQDGPRAKQAVDAWRGFPPGERLSHALVHGIVDHLAADLRETLAESLRPLDIIEGPLMSGMKRVGELFGEGKMFLPQVVKSARVMKQAVALLAPHLHSDPSETRSKAAKVLLATVKGDVHDIGKNIVAVVLECNGYDVVDLGIMVPPDRIVQAAIDEKADIVGLSGLITPSLDEMVDVAKEMERRNVSFPLLVGGATTSEAHTAVKIAPHYRQPVVHVRDASRSAAVVADLLSTGRREAIVGELTERHEKIRRSHRSNSRTEELLPLDQARRNPYPTDWPALQIPQPAFVGRRSFIGYPVKEIARAIDWTFFFHAWRLNGRYPEILEHPEKGAEARKLFNDAETLLNRIVLEGILSANAAIGIFPANAVGDDIEIYQDEKRERPISVLRFLRDQRRKPTGEFNRSLADFVAPRGTGVADYLGGFIVTAGVGIDPWVRKFRNERDDYNVILMKVLADRLAEAFAEVLHEKVRNEFWPHRGGIRPAIGYPSAPDHSEKRTLFGLLDPRQETSVTLTESCAMQPAASVCGYYFSHGESKHFDVGAIADDQTTDYAKRKGMERAEVERWLSPRIISSA